MSTLLVDGNNLVARADHAARGKQVAMSSGEVNTAALVIFANMLSKHVRQVRPDRMAVFWDAGHDFRDEIYPEYKAARKKPAEDGTDAQHFTLCKSFLTWAGIPHKAHTGYEADDLIAMNARMGTDSRTVILSGDKDLLQLVDDSAGVTQIRIPDDREWTEQDVLDKFGVTPDRFAMYLALVGDPGDGVPGLKGVGPKKALKMLEGGVLGVWEALDEERSGVLTTMLGLVNLRSTQYPEAVMLANRMVPTFAPTTPESPGMWNGLVDFCLRYDLRTILERLQDGTMWAERASSQEVFEGFLDTPR